MFDQLHITLPEELLIQSWNAGVVVKALRAVGFDFAGVFDALDDDEVQIGGPHAISFLNTVWRESGSKGSLLSLCSKQWKNSGSGRVRA